MHDTELSYANPDHPWLKRWVIRAIETLSGRSYLLGYYRYWRDAVAATSAQRKAEHVPERVTVTTPDDRAHIKPECVAHQVTERESDVVAFHGADAGA